MLIKCRSLSINIFSISSNTLPCASEAAVLPHSSPTSYQHLEIIIISLDAYCCLKQLHAKVSNHLCLACLCLCSTHKVSPGTVLALLIVWIHSNKLLLCQRFRGAKVVTRVPTATINSRNIICAIDGNPCCAVFILEKCFQGFYFTGFACTKELFEQVWIIFSKSNGLSRPPPFFATSFRSTEFMLNIQFFEARGKVKSPAM